MEINITRFFTEAAPMDYSASVMEIGADAGPATWQAAVDDSGEWMFLDTEDKREAFREWVKGSGGWTIGEIAAWSDVELNALFIQWVSGDMREMGINRPGEPVDWDEIEKRQQAGNISSNIGTSADRQTIYFCLYA